MKKSQIKLFETIAILIIFFFLIAFGMVFYTQLQGRSIKREIDELYELKSINTAQLINYLPEIQCTKENIATENCFDIIKLNSFAQISSQDQYRLYYHNLFFSSRISVEQIYPPPYTTWQIYSSVPQEWDAITKTHLPILLYDPIEKRYNAGVLQIEVYR